MKMLLGFLAGSTLTFVGMQVYTGVSAPPRETDGGYADHGSGLYNRAIEPYYSNSLGEDPGKARLYNDPALRKLTLVEQRPLLQLDRSAIERFCFMPSYTGPEDAKTVASVTASIDLTPEAKAMVGATLAPHEGKTFAFQFLDTPLATFILSDEKRQLFAADADFDLEHADFQFSFRPDALLEGLMFAYEIAGPDNVTMCYDSYSFDDLPNFQTVSPHAQQAYVYWQEGPAEEAFRQNRQDE